MSISRVDAVPRMLATASATQAADPVAVGQFDAAMQSGGPRTAATNPMDDIPAATDEQLAKVPEGDLAKLRQRWGDDDLSMRKEATLFLQMKDQMCKGITMSLLQENMKRIKEMKE